MAPPRINVIIIAVLAITLQTLAVSSLTEESCLTLGFDPTNLSCETCHLLSESSTLSSLQNEYNQKHSSTIDIVQECQACCQSHKFNPVLHPGQNLRGKYRYALLTYDEGSLDQYGEIKDFIDRDLNDILSFKGEGRFRAEPSEKDGGLDNANMLRQLMMGQFYGLGGGQPPRLLFFEKAKKGGWTEEDESEAGEVITLRGWKREDLKDMLMTLLPNA